jgi:hypothetical protein
MAGNFCTKCGNRWTGAARFCPDCGSPVDGGIETKSRSSVRDEQFFERLGLKVRSTGSIRKPDAQQEIMAVPSWLLDKMLSCSFANAPLDTNFLLVEDLKEKRQYLMPLAYLNSLDGLKIHCSLMAHYVVNRKSVGVLDYIRTALPKEVKTAFVETAKRLRLVLDIFLHFEPEDYGKLDGVIRGRWATLEDDKQLCDVDMVAPLTVSCQTMKRSVLEHKEWLRFLSARSDDPEEKEYINTLLEELDAAVQVMTGPFVDHIYCCASFEKNLETQSTELADEEEYDAPAVKSGAFRNISATVAPKSFLPNHQLMRNSLRRAHSIRNIAPVFRSR